jgi:thiol-disulfide isomerase/thioredoxin
MAFVEKMLDKPRAVQSRPGFAAAVAEACDRLLTATPPLNEAKRAWAIQTKLAVLHRAACEGDREADAQLAQAVLALADERGPKLAQELAFYRLEQRVLRAGELAASDIPPLVDEVVRYLTQNPPTAQHLRLASATVAAINRLDDGSQREKLFANLSQALRSSRDREVAAYARQILRDAGLAEASAAPLAMIKEGLIGQPLPLAGITAKGTPLDTAALRGKVVVVDFWATWCGPCRRELPALVSLWEKHHSAGLEVVGVSLDEDLDAVTAFLDEHQIGWPTLVADHARQLADRCGVGAIPTYLLLDREGKVVAAAHQVEKLAPPVAQLLGTKDVAPAPAQDATPPSAR